MPLGFAERSLLAGTMLASCALAHAGQIPGSSDAADVPVSHHDRIYAAEQFSNTVSVTDPADNKLLGVIKLGDAQPVVFSPLYKGQVLVHAWASRPTTARSRSSRSDRTRSVSLIPRPTRSNT